MVIIEPGFTECDDLRVIHQFTEFTDEILPLFGNGGWMNSDDRVDFRILFGKKDRLPARFQRRSDHDDSADAGRFSSIDDNVHFACKFWKIEMRMCVDQHNEAP